jgi:hypothetical protein
MPERERRRPEWLRVIDGSPCKCGPEGPDEYEADAPDEPTYLGTLSSIGRRRDFHMVSATEEASNV